MSSGFHIFYLWFLFYLFHSGADILADKIKPVARADQAWYKALGVCGDQLFKLQIGADDHRLIGKNPWIEQIIDAGACEIRHKLRSQIVKDQQITLEQGVEGILLLVVAIVKMLTLDLG